MASWWKVELCPACQFRAPSIPGSLCDWCWCEYVEQAADVPDEDEPRPVVVIDPSPYL